MKATLLLALIGLLAFTQALAQTKPVTTGVYNSYTATTNTKIVSLSNTAALALSAANSATLTATNALTTAQARLLTSTFNSFTGAQQTTDQNQNADIGNRLLTTTYNNNRTTDQQATTNAQTTANTALSTANSATAAAGGKVDKATTISINGVTQDLSQSRSFSITGSNSTTLTNVSQLTNDAGYQTAGQVTSAVNSATATVVSNQTAVDAAQNTQIGARQPTITGSSSLTAGSLVLTDLSDSDSTLKAITSAYFKRNIPRYLDIPKGNPAQFDTTKNIPTILDSYIRGLFKAATGLAYDATSGTYSLTASVGGGSSSTNVVTGTDPNNTGSMATFLLPPINGGRVFIGNSTYQPYALNLRYLQTIESMPSFRFAVGGLTLGGDADATITRINNVVSFNSSSTGTGTDNGYAFYGSPTRYMQINESNGDKAPLLVRISTAGSMTVTGAVSLSAVQFPNGDVMTRNYVLASASPWIPATTGPNSVTLGDLLTSGLGIPMFNKTQAALQTYITGLANVTTNIPRLYLYGSYDFSAQANVPLTISKNIELIGANGAAFDGGTTNGFLVLFNNISTRLLVENITFRSRATTSPYALTYFNEQGDSRNVTFRNCRWSAPLGNYNAFGANSWNGSSGCFYENWNFENCKVDSVGRMGYEFLAHKNDGVIRIRNLKMTDCEANNVGLYNPANVTKASAVINGMGISLSGDMDGVQLRGFKSLNCLIGIESVSAKNVTIVDPFITGTRSSTYTDAGIIGATGFSLTDGGSTDGGTPGRSTNTITISGGEVNTIGKGIGTYYADGVSITGTRFVAGAYADFQHAKRIMLTGVHYYMPTGDQFIASFGDVQESQIRSSTFSRYNNPASGALYEPIHLDGNTANMVFSDVSINTNTAINGGNPANYYGGQPYRLRYINEAGTNNSLSNIFLNGIKQSDFIVEDIPAAVITAAGSMTLLTHIRQVSFNPTTAISSYTLTLPTTNLDGQQIEVYFGGTLNNNATVVSSLAINGPTSGTPPVQAQTPTQGLAGQVFGYRYRTSTGRWHRYM